MVTIDGESSAVWLLQMTASTSSNVRCFVQQQSGQKERRCSDSDEKLDADVTPQMTL
jgi:hypothetical protein